MQLLEECSLRCDDIERTLHEAEAQWRSVEDRLDDAEEHFLLSKVDCWKKWFSLEEAELMSWASGGPRQNVRGQVRSLLVAALVDQMSQQVEFTPPCADGDASPAERRSGNHLLDVLVHHFETRTKHVVDAAKEEDEKLSKKIRKTEKDERAKGVVAFGMHDTKKVAALKRQRSGIWEDSQKALERLIEPIRRLKEFMAHQVSDDVLTRTLGAVPVIASRTICDWYFQKCLVGYDQLERWWFSTKATLQGNGQVWQALVEKEGLILRRIDQGIEDVGVRQRNYSLYANFGGSELEVKSFLDDPACNQQRGVSPKLEHSIHLLANEVSEMHRRLKQLRDGALWRLVEAAQGIHRQLREEAASEQVPPWQVAGPESGIAALLDALEEKRGDASGAPSSPGSTVYSTTAASPLAGAGDGGLGGMDLMDAALLVMGRLERLCAVASDLRAYFGSGVAHATGGLCDLFGQVEHAAKDLNEDLLELLDAPTSHGAELWLERYHERFGGANLSDSLEHNMARLPLCRDSGLPPKERASRQRWLLLARGLQVLAKDGALRNEVAAPLLAFAASRAPAAAAASGLPSRTATAPMLSAQLAGVEVLSLPPSPRPVIQGGYQYQPPERRPSMRPPADGAPPEGDAAAAPVDGGYLPPWRPETPSTTDSVGSGGRTPSAKWVDGQYIPLRPASAGTRLAPLVLQAPPRNVW